MQDEESDGEEENDAEQDREQIANDLFSEDVSIVIKPQFAVDNLKNLNIFFVFSNLTSFRKEMAMEER